MARGKLKRFRENETFSCLYQFPMGGASAPDSHMKGIWHEKGFANTNPIVLEIGCGQGSYTVALAKLFPDSNFMGMDVKGARIWFGAKAVTEERILNAIFLRGRAEYSESFFAENEIDEIWITFPDPHSKNADRQRRLVSPFFLEKYASFLKPSGFINLKTDNDVLFEYTLSLIKSNNFICDLCSDDVHGDPKCAGSLADIITTPYEQKFLAEGKKIKYVRFSLGGIKTVTE